MAETTERPEQMPEVEKLDYQPVSGWAVAAAAVAGVNVLIILVGGGIALYSWSPYLLPPWTLLVPASGLALALGAQAHIRRSEGTRAGASLARASWWTCLLLGAIYLSFYAATFMAVRSQADSFVHEWFNLLRKGDPKSANLAFLYTQPPERRLGVSPDDEVQLKTRFDIGPLGDRGPLSTFRSSVLTHVIEQGGEEAKLEGRGVQSWEFAEGRYRVVRAYHITTPEGELDVTLTAIGAESKNRAYEGRQWHLFWSENTVSNAKASAFGNQISLLRLQGHKFLEGWKQKLLSGTPENLESAYLDTRPPAEQEKARAEYRAGKADLRGLLDTRNLRAEDEAARAAAVRRVESLFQPARDDDLHLVSMDVQPGGSRRWERTKDGRIVFTFDSNLIFTVAKVPRYRCELGIGVESSPGAVEKGESAGWRVVRIEMLTVKDPFKPRGISGPE